MIDINKNLTAYFTYIKTKFNCWCCCTTPPKEVERPSEDEETFDLRLEIHAHSHGSHFRKPREDTPRPQPRRHNNVLTLD